jgi:UDP-N-acetylmuramoyl-tripeptide--D-alanyl-D-alanine ligase
MSIEQLYSIYTEFPAIQTDSRKIKSGELYFALKGDHFDGHLFAKEALDKGSPYVIVDDANYVFSEKCILVDDVLHCLQSLAQYHRNQFSIPFLAITGSNGKTTTKELMMAVLSSVYKTYATDGNLNNHIGVPLTLLRLRSDHQAAVIEIGVNHIGETAQLAHIAAPTVAVINNAQREHQEFLRSVADVAIEHASVIDALPSTGTAVLNADDDNIDVWCSRLAGRSFIDFGIGSNAGVSAQCKALDQVIEMAIHHGSESQVVALPLLGAHNARNALAAIAAASTLGVPLHTAANALTHAVAVKGRLQVKPTVSGLYLIDDTYNANPDSVKAAIDVLAQMNRPAQSKVLVLGDMGEVGDQGLAFHSELGRYARDRGIDRCYTLGELAATSAASFGTQAQSFRQLSDLLEVLQKEITSDQVVLVKGSRFMRMERVVEAMETMTISRGKSIAVTKELDHAA